MLRRPKFAKYTSAEDVAAFVKWIAEAGELVVVEGTTSASRDPEDDKFLASRLPAAPTTS